MIGINFLEKNNHDLVSLKVPSIIDAPDNFLFDMFDFQNNSIQSFLDYLTFQQITDYIFFKKNTIRVSALVHYLNEIQSDISFYVIQSTNDFQKVESAIKQNIEFIKVIIHNYSRIEYESPDVLPARVKSGASGLSDNLLRTNLISCIFIDDNFDINLMSTSIIKHLSMNTLIIYPENNTQQLAMFPSLSSTRYNEILSSYAVTEHASSHLEGQIELFMNTGTIHNHNKSNIILDYNAIARIFSLHKLVWAKDGVYFDSKKQFKITDNVCITYHELLNIISLRFPPRKDQFIWYFYHILFNLSGHIGIGDNYFITPYNTHKVKEKITTYMPLQLVGIQSLTDCYLYKMKTNTLIKTNKLMLYLLELYLKNILQTESASQYLPQNQTINTKKLINTFLSLIHD